MSGNEKDWHSVAEEAENAEDAVDEAKITADDLIEEEGEAGSGDVEGALEHPLYKELEDKLTAAEQTAHDNWDKAVRAMSELENVKKRADRDVERARKFALENMVKELLPVLDSLDQALAACPAGDDHTQGLRAGVELTLQLFENALAKHAVKSLNPVGEPFDPHAHEAISMQESDEVAPNTVLAVVQKGYQLHERVLRPARVVVAKGQAKKVDEQA